jgi:2-hydroxymuconate-semialdehyde hydrolase
MHAAAALLEMERAFSSLTHVLVALLLNHAVAADSGNRQWVRVAPDDSARVTICGSGPPIVLVAGMIGGTWGFRRVIPGLVQSGHRVIVIDPFDPENGGSLRATTLTSLADRWAAVLDSIGVEHAVIVAHSLANSIVLRVALRHPGLVRTIVSLEGGMVDQVATDGLRAAAAMAPLMRIPGAKSLLRRRVASSLRDRSANGGWVTGEVVEAYTRPFARDMSRAVRLLRRLAEQRETEPIQDGARGIRAPLLLLLGDKVQSSRPGDDEIARMRASLPSFTVDTVANAGHFLQEEQAVAVVERVLRVAAVSVSRVPAGLRPR